VGLTASMEDARNVQQARIKTRRAKKAASNVQYLGPTRMKERALATTALPDTRAQSQAEGMIARMDITHWAPLQNAHSARLTSTALKKKAH
jgi:hypothetical protein